MIGQRPVVLICEYIQDRMYSRSLWRIYNRDQRASGFPSCSVWHYAAVRAACNAHAVTRLKCNLVRPALKPNAFPRQEAIDTLLRWLAKAAFCQISPRMMITVSLARFEIRDVKLTGAHEMTVQPPLQLWTYS